MTGFEQLTNAEEYFEFFQLPYDPTVVQVNRLHILRKFSQLKAEIDAEIDARTDESINGPQQRFTLYRSALQTAYALFLTSSGPEQKLFKVFQDAMPKVVLLSEITEE